MHASMGNQKNGVRRIVRTKLNAKRSGYVHWIPHNVKTLDARAQ